MIIGKLKPIKDAPKDKLLILRGSLVVHESQEQLYGDLSRPVTCIGYWDEIDDAWSPTGGTWEGPWIDATHYSEFAFTNED